MADDKSVVLLIIVPLSLSPTLCQLLLGFIKNSLNETLNQGFSDLLLRVRNDWG